MSVRTTISLPDDLKARMDAVEETVNWSAEAAKCFEKVLGSLAAKKQEKDMNDVIARLKASKIESDDKEKTYGFEVGQRWAEHQASYAELKRAVRFCNEDWGQWDDQEAVIQAGCAICGAGSDWRAGEAFWRTVGVEVNGEVGDDASFLEGFLEGVEAVWNAVADKL